MLGRGQNQGKITVADTKKPILYSGWSLLSGKVPEEVPHCESEVYLYNGVEQGASMLFVRGGEEEHIYPKEAFVPACQLFCDMLLQLCAKCRNRGLRRAKAHKNLDFVLEKPENEGFEG